MTDDVVIIKQIIDDMVFEKDISVKPCIWGNRYVAEYRGTKIEFDFITSYGENGLVQEVTIYPDEYGWLSDHLDLDTYMPEVTPPMVMTCQVNMIAYYTEVENYSPTIKADA